MTTIRAIAADITTLEVDAIVNAAGPLLRHGGGVARAILDAGGPTIRIESDRWIEEHGPVESGVAVVTTAGDMPADRVIHVVGPVYEDGQDNERLLRIAVSAALAAAADAGARSVALPAISAGIYGYPLDDATRVIASEATSWCEDHPNALDEVLLVGYDSAAADAFEAALNT